MGGVILWLFLLVILYLGDNGTSFWFQLIHWGGIAMLVLSLLSLVLEDKKKGYRPVRYGKEKKRADTIYTYLSVYFQTRGNWYYYLTNDQTIKPNDVVVVPWGKHNIQELAIVGWVEHRTAEDVPYPLSRMKYIIRKASDNCRYAFDEMAEWPMEVNVAARWTRDEQGNGIEVINSEQEREKLRAWIRENPRLRPVTRLTSEDLANYRAMALSNW